MENAFRMLDNTMQTLRQFLPGSRRAFLRAGIFFAALLIPVLFASSAPGQNYLTSTGIPAFSAPVPVDLGFVDTSQGNLHLTIPLGSYPQRGTGQPEPITLQYDSNIWNPAAGTGVWAFNNGPGSYSESGWYFSFNTLLAPTEATSQNCSQDIPWMDNNGTTHIFHINALNQGSCPTQANAFATDSSGYHMYWTTTTVSVYAPDGTNISSWVQEPNGNFNLSEDSNGNYLSTSSPIISTLIDTLGRTIATVNSDTGITISTSEGPETYTIEYATIAVNTDFQQQGLLENTGSTSVIRSLTLPDAAHSTYYFTYDCDETTSAACSSPHGGYYYGELTSMTLPTGGTVTYSYATFQDAYGNKNRWVSSYKAAGGTWSYTPQVISTCSATQVNCEQKTTVNSPSGLNTVYTFQLNNGAWPISIVENYGETTITNTWDFSQSCVTIGCYGAAFVRLLNQQTTVSVPGGTLTKQVSFTYDSPQYGNQTAIKEWRYIPSGGSFASVPDRATYKAYLYTGTNNINRPTSVTLCNNTGSSSACPGGGSMVSQTLYTYDAYGSSGLAPITGIANHDDTNFGVSNTERGNPTSISQWVSGSNYLTTSYTYDMTGQVLTATDPAGNITTYGYGDNFFTDGGNGTQLSSYTYKPTIPTNAYLTSVTDAIGTQTMGYYWGSGKEAFATDYNGASTYNHFADGLDRQTEELDPIGWSLATYSSPTQSDMYTAVADTSPSVSCSSCQHTQTILDTWGRTNSQNLVNYPCSAQPLEVESTYYSYGPLASQSHPFCGTGDPNYVFEDYYYDVNGRLTSTGHPDGEYAETGYGEYVGEYQAATSQQGSATTYGYGYPQVSVDEAGLKREQWLDGFGRLIEVDEPNPSALPGASVTITGQESSRPEGDYTVWDSGTVTLTVDGSNFSTSYSENVNTTASEVASTLATEISDDSSLPVTAAVSGSTINLTGKTQGTYSFSVSVVSNYPQYFNPPSYGGSPSSGSLSSGYNGLTSSPLSTNYVYDAGDRITQVVQGSQTRAFAYDGLGRKISETTPEGGTVTYSYTTSGGLCSGDPSNVCQRTDARGVVSTYTYDHANRLVAVAYPTVPSGVSAMPNDCTSASGASGNVCDSYGTTSPAIGRLTQMADATGSESYTYDIGGRVTQISKIIGSQTFNIGYTYDTRGDVTQITYPSGRVVQQAYNQVGQLCEIAPTASGCSDSTYYAGAFSYNSPGKLLGFTYGNGVGATFTWSPTRTQLTSLGYAKSGSTYFSLQYSYQQSSPYSPNCSTGTTGDDGVIECITDGVAPGRTVSYSYDLLGRILSAETAGSSAYPQWGLAETYDRYGNRWKQTATAGSGPQPNLVFGTNGINGSTTNQPNGYNFDPSGNMTVEPLAPANDMTYDGENRMTGFSGGGGAGSYSYDGNGLRVVKSVSGGTTTVSIFSGSSVIAEYDNGAAPSAPSREYIYNGAGDTTGLLAMISGGATTYYHQDQLSVRLTTDVNGNVVTQEGHYPFGELWYETGPANKWFFTSYDQDSESGLDYALARYYDSRTGTFCSADPLAGDPGDPQSWNRYPYGRNDPIDITDPSGQSWFGFFYGLFNVLANISTDGLYSAFLATEDLAFDVNNGQGPPRPYSFGADGVPIEASWGQTASMPSGGLADALGLPTMADVGGPIDNVVPNNYGETIPCGSSASQVMNAVENNFPRFGNYSRWMRAESVKFLPPAGMGPGSTIPIKVGIGGYTENLSVNVQSMNSQSMTFTTNPGHLIYPGSITFAASPAAPGYINFNIHTSGTVAQPFRYNHGGSAFEDAQWNHFLGQVRTFCNGGTQ